MDSVHWICSAGKKTNCIKHKVFWIGVVTNGAWRKRVIPPENFKEDIPMDSVHWICSAGKVNQLYKNTKYFESELLPMELIKS